MHVNALMYSRKFGLSTDTISDCMVPFGDMINHSDNHNLSYYYSWPNRGVCYRADRNIKRGEEVFDTYGKTKSSDAIFFQYAFSLGADHAKWDTVKVPYALNESHPNYKQKKAILDE
jgi:SET domain-containing protein